MKKIIEVAKANIAETLAYSERQTSEKTVPGKGVEQRTAETEVVSTNTTARMQQTFQP